MKIKLNSPLERPVVDVETTVERPVVDDETMRLLDFALSAENVREILNPELYLSSLYDFPLPKRLQKMLRSFMHSLRGESLKQSELECIWRFQQEVGLWSPEDVRLLLGEIAMKVSLAERGDHELKSN